MSQVVPTVNSDNAAPADDDDDAEAHQMANIYHKPHWKRNTPYFISIENNC
jgi:hypothetical protein